MTSVLEMESVEFRIQQSILEMPIELFQIILLVKYRSHLPTASTVNTTHTHTHTHTHANTHTHTHIQVKVKSPQESVGRCSSPCPRP